jgi:hypothetical protein
VVVGVTVVVGAAAVVVGVTVVVGAAAVVVGVTVVVGAATVVAGAALSEPPPHAEANRASTRVAVSILIP